MFINSTNRNIVVFILLILGSLAFIRKIDSVITGGDLQDFFVSVENDKVFSQQELYSSLNNFKVVSISGNSANVFMRCIYMLYFISR